jgi:hypothetical protein
MQPDQELLKQSENIFKTLLQKCIFPPALLRPEDNQDNQEGMTMKDNIIKWLIIADIVTWIVVGAVVALLFLYTQRLAVAWLFVLPFISGYSFKSRKKDDEKDDK